MKKALVILAVLLMMLATAACGVKNADTGNMLFTDGGSGTANENNAEAYISGEDADTANAGEAASAYSGTEGLPSGFPAGVPFYDGAQILEADAYGDDGYTVVYQVNAKYSDVVAYYMTALPWLDKSGIGDDESYFEGFDLNDGIHINGLTISDADGATQVFITLKGAGGGISYEDDTDYGAEDINETESDYDSISGLALKDGYPGDVVPVYEGLKLTTSSGTPSGDLFAIEGVAPPDSFDDAAGFYQNALGVAPKAFDSPSMRTVQFEGVSGDWSYSVYVAEIYTSGNTVIQISLTK